ncbi:DUF262 domain-containing protein [Phytohabitans suffuscus]|uniref:DUF262 domain-containing protein n=1 Tax=Phytohabitans suffuscus TaxID=624315 RepID=A0A6F8YCB4_9ACTN|nr:DUF262 domain-containing protein [Phytohabitans suffuscus]BCB83673.1 hypothetical protein Psuf_009860 [Phytohabitans suffuscus]
MAMPRTRARWLTQGLFGVDYPGLVDDNGAVQRLEASEVPLHKIFCSDYDFRIPHFQRPYAWDEDNAAQLLFDLRDALERGEDEPYFLGSLVLVKEPHNPKADVIDGQQRLTTLTILLAVLRDLAGDATLRKDLEERLIEPGSPLLGLDPKPRLTLRPRDADFFAAYVQQVSAIPELLALKPDALKTDAQRAIRTNAATLHHVLTGPDWSDERRLALAKMISTRTFLVVVVTQDLASAHRIFSVMNARGVDLSPADIFKSQVLGDLGSDLSDKYAERWEGAEDALGREAFAELFSYVRLIFSGQRADKELLKEFPEQVLDKHYLPGKATQFVDEVIVPYADAYGRIRSNSYECGDPDLRTQVNAWLRRLNRLDNADWRPVALWAMRHHGDDPATLVLLMRALERLAASLLIRGVYSTPRALRYAALVRELTGGAGLDAPSLQLTDSEKDETHAVLGGDLYLSAKVCKYVLLRLDEVLADDPGVTFNHQIITVEHVLPRNPAANSLWLQAFTDDERVLWTHKLANLVLLNRRKNSGAQNYDFDKKKTKYFLAPGGVATFALTVQVLSHAQWTPALLEQRQQHLLQSLQTEWNL